MISAQKLGKSSEAAIVIIEHRINFISLACGTLRTHNGALLLNFIELELGLWDFRCTR